MKKILYLIIVLFLGLSFCDNSATTDRSLEQTENKIENTGPSEQEETTVPNEDFSVIEKKIIYYTIEPIKEDVDFYYFEDCKTLRGFKDQNSEIIKIYGIINYKNGTSEKNEIREKLEFFFTRNGNIHFQWRVIDMFYEENGTLNRGLVKYFIQENGIVTEVYQKEGGSDIIEREGIFCDYSSTNFKIGIYAYEGNPYSHICNFFMQPENIFGRVYDKIGTCYENEKGIFFDVIKEGETVHSCGLYFYPKNRTSTSKILGEGRLWVK